MSSLPSYAQDLGDGIWCIDTGSHRPRYDAAYLLRAPTAKAGAWDDLCRARALAAANQAKPVNG